MIAVGTDHGSITLRGTQIPGPVIAAAGRCSTAS